MPKGTNSVGLVDDRSDIGTAGTGQATGAGYQSVKPSEMWMHFTWVLLALQPTCASGSARAHRSRLAKHSTSHAVAT